jgi:hypothetical protein
MRIQKFSRPGVILVATVVAIITSVVVANATQSLTTSNAAFISYSLAPNTNRVAITPAATRSVLIMGCCSDQSSDEGVGQVSLVRIAGAFLQWVGLESAYNAAITQGVALTAGDHIVYIDRLHQVDIQLASADTIRVHNGSTGMRAGNVTLVW